MADSKKKNDKELSYKELVAKRDELKKEYMDLRFKMVVSHVDNPLQKRTIRREIARLNTFIRQKEIAYEKKKELNHSRKYCSDCKDNKKIFYRNKKKKKNGQNNCSNNFI